MSAPDPSVEFGCDHCADDVNRFFEHVRPLARDEERGMLLLKCHQCGALYEQTPTGGGTRRLTREQAESLFTDFSELSERAVKIRSGQMPDSPPVAYNNVWAREGTTGPDRLLVGAAGSAIDVMLALAATMEEPYAVLYVLQVPRGSAEAGRYQSYPLAAAELADFLDDYREYFERDARHQIWIGARSGNGGQLVYDEHDVIFAYGDLDAYIEVLQGRGFIEAGWVGIEGGHLHCYNDEFDADQTRILADQRGWIHTPLRPEDER